MPAPLLAFSALCAPRRFISPLRNTQKRTSAVPYQFLSTHPERAKLRSAETADISKPDRAP